MRNGRHASASERRRPATGVWYKRREEKGQGGQSIGILLPILHSSILIVLTPFFVCLFRTIQNFNALTSPSCLARTNNVRGIHHKHNHNFGVPALVYRRIHSQNTRAAASMSTLCSSEYSGQLYLKPSPYERLIVPTASSHKKAASLLSTTTLFFVPVTNISMLPVLNRTSQGNK